MQNTIPFPSESFIEDFIYNSIKEENICPVSGDHINWVLRQPNFGSYGRPDIIKLSYCVYENTAYITVLELKNTELKGADLVQLSKYMKCLKSFFNNKYNNKIRVKIRGELAGHISKSNDIVFLHDCLENVDIYKISCSIIDGFNSDYVNDAWDVSNPEYGDVKDYVKDGLMFCKDEIQNQEIARIVQPYKSKYPEAF